MNIEMTLSGFFDVCEDDEGYVLIIGQETDGNTFTIRARRKKEVIGLIKDLKKWLNEEK